MLCVYMLHVVCFVSKACLDCLTEPVLHVVICDIF